MKLGYNLPKIFIKNNINSLGTSTNQHSTVKYVPYAFLGIFKP